jgi:hypothetical protein
MISVCRDAMVSMCMSRQGRKGAILKSVDDVSEGGWSALHVAGIYNSGSAAGAAIDAQGDVFLRDYHGRTPLHLAAANNAVEALTHMVAKAQRDKLDSVRDNEGDDELFYWNTNNTYTRLSLCTGRQHSFACCLCSWELCGVRLLAASKFRPMGTQSPGPYAEGFRDYSEICARQPACHLLSLALPCLQRETSEAKTRSLSQEHYAKCRLLPRH